MMLTKRQQGIEEDMDGSDLSPVTGCGRQCRSFVDRRDIE